MTSKHRERLENIFYKAKYYGNWNIGLITGEVSRLIAKEDLIIKWYGHQTKDTFLADPFIVSNDGKDYIFVEEYDHAVRKGHISVIYDWNRSPRKIIDEPYHLSYPFLIRENGQLYMIPEGSESGRLDYYVCRNFPFEWEKAGTLINEEIVDPTILEWNDKYWLFYTMPGQSRSHLYIRYADSLWGDWVEHKGNPVKIDPTNCRPAGPFFSVNGVLYRPAQDSSTNYGSRIVINEVTELTTDSFREEPRRVISPENYYPYIGMHHVSFAGMKIAIDGRRTIKELKSFRDIKATLVSGFMRLWKK
jgi:hypothetical protein